MSLKTHGCTGQNIMIAMISICMLSAAGELRDPAGVNPDFPRIGTCYGASLSWRTWEQGKEWWSKLDLIIGGGYDLHYDWENPRWDRSRPRLLENLTHLREVNPDCLFLPYVDVVEGPDNPNIPAAWWDLRNGERWSGWPGFFRINTKLPEVLQFNLDKTREEIMAHDCFDGVFYDCWGPDDWLVPRTAALRDGRAIVMLNDWNLPAKGFASLNGCLAEDELNRVAEGKVDFEDYLGRYLAWCRNSRKPAVTMLVCHPRNIAEDPWKNHTRSREERLAAIEKARTADPQMMRFGLTTTLMGDGYFGFDGGNGLSRGNWWWYPEYDAPLGFPLAPAERRPDGLWQRNFDGGMVIVNGTAYDAVVKLPARMKDISTARIADSFMVPMCDGRILLPTEEPFTPGADRPPRLTREAPAQPEVLRLDNGTVLLRAPSSLEVRFAPGGAAGRILFAGETLMTGGWPGIYLPPMRRFEIADHAEPELSRTAESAQAVFRGELVQDNTRIEYVETCTMTHDGVWNCHFDFRIPQDLELRMWRHYVAFPVARYAGAEAETDDARVHLPEELGDAQLLPAGSTVRFRMADRRITVRSSVPMGLVDHRKWHSEEYLLAGYPLNGRVPAGTTLSVDLSVAVSTAAETTP